ncbi:hypothetical protein DMENIID0001_003530 [Sergentomyia squamirostris]
MSESDSDIAPPAKRGKNQGLKKRRASTSDMHALQELYPPGSPEYLLMSRYSQLVSLLDALSQQIANLEERVMLRFDNLNEKLDSLEESLLLR